MNQFQFNLESLFKHKVTNNEPQIQFVNNRYIYYNESRDLKKLDLMNFDITTVCQMIVPIYCYQINEVQGLAYIGHSNGEFSIVDIVKEKIKKSFKVFESTINIFDINHQYQVGVFGNQIGLLSSIKLQTGEIVNQIDSQQKKITQIKVLRNLVITAGLQSIVCRDLYLNQQIWKIKRHSNFITKLIIDEKKKLIYSGQFHGKLFITSLENQESFNLDTKDSFEFAQIGNEFLIVSELNELSFWDLKNYKKIQVIKHDNFINRISYCQKRDLIIVVSSNYELEIFQIQRIIDSQNLSIISNNQENLIKRNNQNQLQISIDQEQSIHLQLQNNLQEKFIELQKKFTEQQNELNKLKELKKYEFFEELESFKGIILNGQKYGLCKEIHKNGDKFIGNYSNNMKNGPGELQLGSKTIQGNFINNYIRGDLIIEDLNTQQIIEGSCEIFKNINSPIKINSIFNKGIKKEIIKGKFINEKLNGYCSIIFNDQFQILGNFKNDILQIDQDSCLVEIQTNKNYPIIFYTSSQLKTDQNNYMINQKEGILKKIEQLNFYLKLKQQCKIILNQKKLNFQNFIDVLVINNMNYLFEKLIKLLIKLYQNLIIVQEYQIILWQLFLQLLLHYTLLVYQQVRRKNVILSYSFALYFILKKATQPLALYYVNTYQKTPIEEIANWKYCREDSKKIINTLLNRVVQLNKNLYNKEPEGLVEHLKQFHKLQTQLPRKKDLQVDIYESKYYKDLNFSEKIKNYFQNIYTKDIKNLDPSTEYYDILIYSLILFAPFKYLRIGSAKKFAQKFSGKLQLNLYIKQNVNLRNELFIYKKIITIKKVVVFITSILNNIIIISKPLQLLLQNISILIMNKIPYFTVNLNKNLNLQWREFLNFETENLIKFKLQEFLIMIFLKVLLLCLQKLCIKLLKLKQLLIKQKNLLKY